jgi:hypothetical protein
MRVDAKNQVQSVYAHSIAAVSRSDISLLALPKLKTRPQQIAAEQAASTVGYT